MGQSVHAVWNWEIQGQQILNRLSSANNYVPEESKLLSFTKRLWQDWDPWNLDLWRWTPQCEGFCDAFCNSFIKWLLGVICILPSEDLALKASRKEKRKVLTDTDFLLLISAFLFATKHRPWWQRSKRVSRGKDCWLMLCPISSGPVTVTQQPYYTG